MDHSSQRGDRACKACTVSTRRRKPGDAIEMTRQAREAGAQSLGDSARPFVLCGLPILTHQHTLDNEVSVNPRAAVATAGVLARFSRAGGSLRAGSG